MIKKLKHISYILHLNSESILNQQPQLKYNNSMNKPPYVKYVKNRTLLNNGSMNNGLLNNGSMNNGLNGTQKRLQQESYQGTRQRNVSRDKNVPESQNHDNLEHDNLEHDLMQIALSESIYTENKKIEAGDIAKALERSMEYTKMKDSPIDHSYLIQSNAIQKRSTCVISDPRDKYVSDEKLTDPSHSPQYKKDTDSLKRKRAIESASTPTGTDTSNIINQMHHNNQDQYEIDQKYATAPHIDFIVGRGKNAPRAYMNFPMNHKLLKRNLIYIDPNPAMDSDVKQLLHDVDFSLFGICKNQEQNPNEEIMVRFFFDWSSFYCGAVQSLTDVILRIGRKCQIFVPLSIDEQIIPSQVKNELCSNIFTLNTVEGLYPLFDWNAKNQTIPRVTTVPNHIPITTMIRNVINPDRYMRIDAYAYSDL